MMKSFDVNEPNFNFQRPLLLEASAGTGKTYSIENSVARVLLEGDISIREILVVTFTKAAAKDLKKRIKQCLIQKMGKVGCSRKIKQALAEFDQACISTIHSFCYRALQEHSPSAQGLMDPDVLPDDLAWEVVERYFRTALSEEIYSPAQVNILLKQHGNSVSRLGSALVKKSKEGISFGAGMSNNEGLSLLSKVDLSPDLLMDAILKHAHSFYSMTDKSKSLKKELRQIFQSIAELLGKDSLKMQDLDPILEEGEKALLLLACPKKKAEIPTDVLFLFKTLGAQVLPVLRALGNYHSLFVRLAGECQKRIYAAFDEKDSSDFTYLLIKMQQMVLNDPVFVDNLRKAYRWVIIDEFQDTDPIQWTIFNELFFKGGIPVILVGDPKQSIYAFRSADIYTYIDAKDSIPSDSHYILDTNWRSSSRLINALNHFFNAPGWLPLPYLKRELTYNPVLAPLEAKKKDSNEPPLQFLVAQASEKEKLEDIESRFFFPRFVEEVQKLTEQGIPLSKIAFLVRDHAQSKRLYQFFLKQGLPAFQQKGVQKSKAEVLPDLIHLLRAWLSPRNLGLLQAALGTPFFKWSLEKMQELASFEKLVEVVFHFHMWGQGWRGQGIGVALQEFLATRFVKDEASLQENLVSSSEGRERYHELRQLIEWIAIRESEERLSPEESLEAVESLLLDEYAAQDQNGLRPLVEKDAVPIMTLHMSKGLEFEAVFALGVVNRSPIDKGIIAVRENGTICLKSVSEDDPAYTAYLEENDAEKSRQLYVALTRAKSRLYIPVVEGFKEPVLGGASPIELYLARIMPPKADWKILYERLKESQIQSLESLVKMSPDCALERLLPNLNPAPFCKEASPNLLVEPKGFQTLAPEKWAVSFTGLVKKRGSLHSNLLSSPSIETLPLGATTGELIHKIMEEIPFKLIQEAQESAHLHPFIYAYIAETPFELWLQPIADMIFATFKTNIEPLGFSLDQIEETNCFREMEFVYPLKIAQEIPECSCLNGVVKGVIDLFFIHEGRYYILDWKTNWLGNDPDDYSGAALEQAMLVHGYDLQAGLYRLAIQQYLKKVDGRPFEDIFGGVLYYFMRGTAVHFIPERLNAFV